MLQEQGIVSTADEDHHQLVHSDTQEWHFPSLNKEMRSGSKIVIQTRSSIK